MLLPIGRLAVLRTFPSARYLSAIAVVSIAGQVGPLLGPVLGGWLVQAISWHWIFLINLPIGLVGCIAVLVFLPRTLPLDTRPRFDMTGFALLSVCMVAFSLALDSAGGAKAWHWIAGLMALSAVAGWAYVPHARRHASPLFPLSLFERPTFRQGLIGNLIARVGASAVPFLMPLLFQLELGYTPLQSGMMMLPVAIAGVACKSLVSPLVKTFWLLQIFGRQHLAGGWFDHGVLGHQPELAAVVHDLCNGGHIRRGQLDASTRPQTA